MLRYLPYRYDSEAVTNLPLASANSGPPAVNHGPHGRLVVVNHHAIPECRNVSGRFQRLAANFGASKTMSYVCTLRASARHSPAAAIDRKSRPFGIRIGRVVVRIQTPALQSGSSGSPRCCRGPGCFQSPRLAMPTPRNWMSPNFSFVTMSPVPGTLPHTRPAPPFRRARAARASMLLWCASRPRDLAIDRTIASEGAPPARPMESPPADAAGSGHGHAMAGPAESAYR